MLKITANSSEDFSKIEAALVEFDENEVFLRYFDTAVQSEADVEGVTVILRNSKKFRKDLNKKKYIIHVPTSLVIDAFELVKKFEGKGGKRVPFYSVLIKGHLPVSGVNVILMLIGFNDDNIRVLSHDEDPIVDGDSDSEGNGSNGDSCPLKPITNRDMYHMYYRPEPLGGMMPPPPECCMPFINNDEESFIIDTLD